MVYSCLSVSGKKNGRLRGSLSFKILPEDLGIWLFVSVS